jgi:hypothetical protein
LNIVCCSAELSALPYGYSVSKQYLAYTAIPYQTGLFRHEMHNASWDILPIILYYLNEWCDTGIYGMWRSLRILFTQSIIKHLHNLIYTFKDSMTHHTKLRTGVHEENYDSCMHTTVRKYWQWYLQVNLKLLTQVLSTSWAQFLSMPIVCSLTL